MCDQSNQDCAESSSVMPTKLKSFPMNILMDFKCITLWHITFV